MKPVHWLEPFVSTDPSGTVSGGVVADSNGNAGAYTTIAGGPAVGGGFKVAANAAVSNAPTINDLQGWGAGATAFFGVGGAGSVDWSKGYFGDGQVYNSVGGSLGLGLGGGVGAGPSYTWIWPVVTWPESQQPTAGAISSLMPSSSFDFISTSSGNVDADFLNSGGSPTPFSVPTNADAITSAPLSGK